MKRRYDRKHVPLLLEPGDLVLLSTKSHASLQEVRKLQMRFTGPYVVLHKVHDNAYALDGLPPEVPATQNVSFLRRFYPSPEKFASRPQPGEATQPIAIQDHHEWAVAEIKDHTLSNGQYRYLIRWQDFDQETWVRPSQLRNCAQMLREYQEAHGIEPDCWSSEASSPESDDTDPEEDPLPDSAARSDVFSWEDG